MNKFTGMALALCSVQAGFAMNAVDAKTPAADQPNIILLMSEDIGNDLACYGTKGVQTPNLDRLAEEGVRYTRFYTNAPICSPSRTSIMSGMYQGSVGGHHHRTRGNANPNKVTPMTHYLRSAGYTTILGSPLVYKQGKKTDLNFRVKKLFDTQKPFSADKQPFFNQIQHKVTHRAASSDLWEEIRAKSASPVDVSEIELPPYLPDVPEVRLDWATYLDSIEEMDREVGAIIDDLKKKDILENTIIIFIGDNGRCQVRGKSYLFEDGIRCPLIVWGKGIPKGKVVDDLVSGVDLTATILQLAGIDKPEQMHGQAFLRNPNYKANDYIFAARDRHDEVMDCSRTIVGQRYKYIRNYMPEVPWYAAHHDYYSIERVRPILPLLVKMNKEGKLNKDQAYFFSKTKPLEQLYDLQNDPWELNNLADSSDYASIKAELRRGMESWIERVKDQGLKKDDNGEWMPTADVNYQNQMEKIKNQW